MTKLFVGGIPYALTNQELQELFSKYGSVVSATIVTDKFSGQSKGFAFVEMDNDEEAQQAIKELDGSEVGGRKIGVSVARPREEGQSHGGGFNRGGGDRRDNRPRRDFRR